MLNIKLALRSLFRRGNGNLIKILSLGIGLAVGIVLIAKVCFELSYDNCFSNGERIYIIKTGVDQQGEKKDFAQVSGGVSQGFKDFVPGVEEATRTTFLFNSEKYITPDNKKYTGTLVLADSNFFKIFDRPILAGDPVKVLGSPREVMVSHSFAKKMGGISEALGKTISNSTYPSYSFTISGVFEDFPENSSIDYDILLSMTSYRKESYENWLGNDRYRAYVKLVENIDPSSLAEAIHKMQEANQPLEELEKSGTSLWYFLAPFNSSHTESSSVKNTIIILSIVALALILAAVMNYILIVISSLVRRTKEVGVRKCYGAKGGNIRAIMLTETALHLILSLLLSAALIFAFRGTIEELLNSTLKGLFIPESLITIIILCLVVFLVSGLIPSYVFQRIPVATVFRNYRESKRRWKLALLFFQFTLTAFLCTLLIIIGKQYSLMANDRPGYEYDNLLIWSNKGIPRGEVTKAIDQIKTLSFVSMVEGCNTLPIDWASGNNISLPGDDRELFNISDQYESTDGYFDLLKVKVLEGKHPTAPKEVAVSRKFVERMSEFTDWSDGAVGKEVMITEHSQTPDAAFTIVGVYEDYRLGPIYSNNKRPSVVFWDMIDSDGITNILIGLHKLSSSNIEEVSKILKESFPDKDIELSSYKEEMRGLYTDVKKFRNSVMIGGIITLIIALIGLIAYTIDETNRRSSEIAIRKINGAVSKEIVTLFLRNALIISMPAVILGSLSTLFLSDTILGLFSEKIRLSPSIFIISCAAILSIIIVTTILSTLKISRSNPIKSIKND